MLLYSLYHKLTNVNLIIQLKQYKISYINPLIVLKYNNSHYFKPSTQQYRLHSPHSRYTACIMLNICLTLWCNLKEIKQLHFVLKNKCTSCRCLSAINNGSLEIVVDLDLVAQNLGGVICPVIIVDTTSMVQHSIFPSFTFITSALKFQLSSYNLLISRL